MNSLSPCKYSTQFYFFFIQIAIPYPVHNLDPLFAITNNNPKLVNLQLGTHTHNKPKLEWDFFKLKLHT
jgi:hypothetical protein